MPCRSLTLALMALLLAVAGCSRPGTATQPSPTASPAPTVEGIVFAYGPRQPANVLDTTRGLFTKDMVLAPPLTVPFRLDAHELARISQRIIAIDFWSYPSEYVSHGHGRWVEPPVGVQYGTRLTVTTDQGSKTVSWKGGFYADDQRARELRGLAELIWRIIVTKPEYQRLPPAEGGYL